MSNDRLDDLNKKLYSPQSPDVVNKRVEPLREKSSSTPSDWKHETGTDDEVVIEIPVEKKSKTGAWIFAVCAFLFCAGSFVFAWHYIVNKGGAGDNVSVYLTGPVSVPGGKDYTFDVTVENRNNFPINLVDLVIDYPPGSRDVKDISQDIDIYREGLGTLAAGEKVTRKLSVVLFGSEREKQDIIAKAEYHIPNSDATFESTKTVDVLIESGPVEFVLQSLKEATLNQEVELLLRVTSNTDQELKNLVVRGEYPSGFAYISSTPAPAKDSNVWTIASLAPQGTSTIRIRGMFSGEANAERFFRFEGGVADKNDPNKIAGLFASSLEGVTLVRPFLGVALKIDEDEVVDDVVIKAGKQVTAKIEFTNNLEVPLTDVSIEALLKGTTLDKKNVNSFNGSYRSAEDKVVWNKNNIPTLARLDPGKTSFVTVNFGALPLELIGPLLRNQSIVLDISTKAKRPSDTNVPEEVKSTIVRNFKLQSDVALSARSVHYIGPFTNSGPIPPAIEQKTSYTVIWTVTNSLNDIRNTSITGYLPDNVTWLGAVSPSGERVTYDDKTGKVTWNAGNIPAGSGYSRPAREMAFQVSLFPSANQIGEVPNLVQEIEMSADDAFTSTAIPDNPHEPVTIRIATDPNYSTGMDRVVE